MIRLGEHVVTGSNLAHCRDPKTAQAVMEFYKELVDGRAIVRTDKMAPPLAIELEDRQQ